mgnify:FL=1
MFLDIYPKNGPFQQLDIADEELKDLVKQFVSEARMGLLGIICCNFKLKELKPKIGWAKDVNPNALTLAAMRETESCKDAGAVSTGS